MALEHVAELLHQQATDCPTQPAIWIPKAAIRRQGNTPHQGVSFAELNLESDQLARGLLQLGFQRGDRVAFMVPPSRAFFSLTFAFLKAGIIPVMIDPGMGLKGLGKCLDEAAPTGFIGIAKAHWARRLLGWAKGSIQRTIHVGSRRHYCTASLAEVQALGDKAVSVPLPEPAAADTSAILFTSGSTGLAKGVPYTQGIFAHQVQLLKQVYGIQPGEIDLCTFPLFALFGPALGMTCVIPHMNPSRPATLDPALAVQQLRQFRVTNLFGSPAVVRNLALGQCRGQPCVYDRHQAKEAMQSLRRVISAGAPANLSVIAKLQELLPAGVEVFTPYGATEALPVANCGSQVLLNETRIRTEHGEGVCVGKPVPGMTVQVLPIQDDPIATWETTNTLPPGQVGEFVVRGPVVTQQYFQREQATALAKIHDPTTGEALHRMGDVGWIDVEGRLWFCGRKSHRVRTASGVLFTDQVEPIYNTVPGVRRTALVGVPEEHEPYQTPVLCVEAEVLSQTLLEKLHALSQQHPTLRAIQTFLHYPGTFPVDIRHNSKIFREKLAVWAAKHMGNKKRGRA